MTAAAGKTPGSGKPAEAEKEREMSRFDDNRSKKIIFVSSCLLNTNNKVRGLARYPGMCKEVFDTLHRHDLGIQQMDCPETLYIGINRWWYTKNLYDNHGFRTHCRECAERVVTYMEEYKRAGYKTVGVLSCDGSPTCGVSGSSRICGASVCSASITSYGTVAGMAPKRTKWLTPRVLLMVVV